MLHHPEIAFRSCADCKKYSYRDGPDGMGEQQYRRDEKGRMTLPEYRPLNSPLPCHWCPKIPRGALPVPESAAELDERGWAIYDHYQRCKAISWQTPDAVDPHVQRHAAIIRQIEDDYQGGRTARELAPVLNSFITALFAALRR